MGEDLFEGHDGRELYTVLLDKRWQLDDLTIFSKAYEESYFAVFGLLSVTGELPGDHAAKLRVARAFRSYPWLGGYSAVNFFGELKRAVPRRERPTVQKITYASPGFIELFLDQHVAVQIGAAVTSICGTIKLANSTYHSVYKGYIERRLAQVSLEKAQLDLDRDKLNFIAESNAKLCNILSIQSVDKLNIHTGNELRTLKILLAVYRRLQKLAKLQAKGKISLPRD
ncbi:hypothetical protein HGG67_04290 [Rhodobacteraceae bacterium R_SAG8]|nr:hypothetical protein [Rhodobacteraceae bacterium R_SAG8]